MNADEMSLAVIEEYADATIRRVKIDGTTWFSVVDTIALLTESPTPRTYWAVLKGRLQDEGAHQLLTTCKRLKMVAADGKQRFTDAADLQTMLRIVQSVPSPNAEPIKLWLAKVGASELTGGNQVPVSEPVTVAQEADTVTVTPALSDDVLLELARYHDHMSKLYRQQASLRSRLESLEAVTRGYEQQMLDLLLRVEAIESNQTTLPDILGLLHPENLSLPHQSLIRRWTQELCGLTGWHLNMVYQDLLADFAYENFSDATEADWARIQAWFQVRLEDTRKRR